MPYLRDRLLGTDRRGVALLVGLGLCMVLGGGDVLVPWLDVAVQLCVAVLALGWFWTAPRARIAAIPVSAWVMSALVVALPLVQLIPLPPGLWYALPGRELERQALALVGQENSWRPLSMMPDRTLAAALSAVCAALFVPMVAGTDRGGRSRLMMVVVAVGVLSVLVGAQQLTGSAGSLFQFYDADSVVLRGFQWNRNSEADVLLLAMLAAAGCTTELLRLHGMERRRRLMLALLLGLTVLFALGVVLTRSRTGILFILPVVVLQGVVLRQQVRLRLGLLVLPLVGAGVLVLARNNDVVSTALGHFQDGAALRPSIWSHAWALARGGLPWGVGLGGFSTAFARVETLDMVNPMYVAHAYEDYLQLAVEAGLAGLLVLGAVIVWVARAALLGLRAPVEQSRAQYLVALFSLLVLAGHSFWDYPLHATSLAVVAACYMGMLAPLRAVPDDAESAPRSRGRRRGQRRAMPVRVALGLVALVYGVVAVGNGMDRASANQGEVAALVPAPFAVTAHAVLAREALTQHQGEGLPEQARLAVAAQPLDAANLGMLGYSDLLKGDRAGAEAAYLVADRMGWRDRNTQAFMMQRAIDHGDYDGAVARLDALLRQRPADHRVRAFMDPIEGNLYAQDALVRLLARRPPWLGTYISDVWALPSEQLGMRMAVLASLADHGTRLGCGDIDQMVHQLVMREDYEDAHTLWGMHCQQEAGNLLWDGHMAELSEQPDPRSDFRWQLIGSGDLTTSLYGMGREFGGDGKGQWIEVANNGAFPQPFVHQMVVVDPGQYRLRWMVRTHDGKPGKGIAPVLDCGEVAMLPSDGAYAQAQITVPASCTRIWLSFTVAAQATGVIFGNVSLTGARVP